MPATAGTSDLMDSDGRRKALAEYQEEEREEEDQEILPQAHESERAFTQACRNLKHRPPSKDTTSEQATELQNYCKTTEVRNRDRVTHDIDLEKNHRQEDRTRRLRTPSLTCKILLCGTRASGTARARMIVDAKHKQHADGHLWSRRLLARSDSNRRGVPGTDKENHI